MRDYGRKIVIDWIEFRLMLPKPTQFQWVQDRLERINGRTDFVEALAPGPGGVSSSFRVRLQDPRHLRSLGGELQKSWPGCCTRITGLEMALDSSRVAPGNADDLPRQLAEEAFDLYKWMQPVTEGAAWHLYRRRGEARDVGGLGESAVIDHLADDWQLTDHNKNRSTSWVRYHVHVKTTDRRRRGEPVKKLPQALWRARFEITLHGPALPWCELDELAAADFTQLHEWFKFRQPGPQPLSPGSSLPPSMAMALAAALRSRLLPADMQPGRRGRYRRPVGSRGGARRHGKPREFRSGTRADTPLNECVYDGLRRLRGMADPPSTGFSGKRKARRRS